MIIKIIPETDEEKQRFMEKFSTDVIEHFGIKEYFIFGNKTDSDGRLSDFHEWTGSPRYIMANLNYFYEIVNDERRVMGKRNVEQNRPVEQKTKPPLVFQNPDDNIVTENIKKKAIKNNFEKGPKIVKKGEMQSNIVPIDITNLGEGKKPKIVHVSPLEQVVEQNEQNEQFVNETPVPEIPLVDKGDGMMNDN